ncbi:MAG: anthranilate synthase component I [Candidatus Korarchaeum sp.]
MRWGIVFGSTELSFVRLYWDLRPLDLFSILQERFEYSYLLESAEGPDGLADYSFVGFEPKAVVRVKNGIAEIIYHDKHISGPSEDPLQLLPSLVGRVAESRFRFIGGAVGYISYDSVRYWEKLPKLAVDDLHFPDLEMAIYDDGFIFDHKTGDLIYYHSGESKLRDVELAVREGYSLEALGCSEPKSNLKKEEFGEIVSRSKEYIASGDVFQVVLSRRYDLHFDGSLIPFYRKLRQLNPSPYMYFLKMGKRQIVGASPEMLVRVDGLSVETYPIAGTRPRVKEDPSRDEALELELINDPKERAEHIMLVDLARNDLGRVSEFGTVRVIELMKVYKYSHVQHMVSRVAGSIRRDCNCYDALKAVFPAGTVSGAPKVRAMEIIEELEPVRRGPYAGAVGYFSKNGNADFAIAIRTLFAQGDRAYVQVGAGVVADSVPEMEWFETEQKALAVLRALEMSSRGG